ncbi:outer membrane beta-barrel protein [Pontibacter anaerobius]|uniref:Outer membrane beta-barrel protein n=1 Tax=Pontibacter anaerobius TaxID=2993940 RepID=A0ABT3RFN5_9BACT|nr:outer membrane beta-barrel protein [Pontibacter anaerobius]MCX2740283.1 outer membrane beta-barrel protein [Pontibacter anaerobius]
MKKLLAAAVFAFLGTSAFAQTSQGTVAITGSLSFNSTNREDGSDLKSNSFSIGPSVGYFVADNLVVGLGINYSREASKSTEVHYGGYYSGPYPVEWWLL